MPMYFEVSRTTEIDTPSPARLAWKMSSALIFVKSPFTRSATTDSSPDLMRQTNRRTMPADAISASRPP